MSELPREANEPAPIYVSHLVRRLRETEEALQKLQSGSMSAARGTAARPAALQNLSDDLRKSEERFNQLFHAAATGIAISTPLGRFLKANAAYCEMLGYTETELQSFDWAALTHPDDLHVNLELRDQMLRGQRSSFVMEKRYVRKNGEPMSARISVSAVHEANGEISNLLVMAEDVTERNRAHERLHRLNRLYTVLGKIGEAVLRMPDRQELYDLVCRMAVEIGQLRMAFVAAVDADAKVAYPVASYGEGLPAMLGPAGAIAIGESPMSFGTVAAVLQSGNCDVCNDIAGVLPMEPWREAALQNGLRASASIPLKSYGNIAGVLSLYAGEKDFFRKDEVDLMSSVANTISFALEARERDVQRQQAEALSRQLAAVVEFADDPILSTDTNGIITSWNKGSEKTFGYSKNEMIGHPFLRLVPEERHDEERQIFAQILSGSEGVDSHETVRRTKSGNLINVSSTISPIRNADGEIVGMSRVSRDITQAKRAESRLRRLMDSNVQGVFFWEMNGSVLDANDAFLALTRFTRDDLMEGRINWSAITPPEYEELDRRAVQLIAENGRCTPYEKEFIRKDGSRVPILLGAAKFEDMPDEGVCFVLDLTEQKKLERQVLQAQKMESIGALAAGVAHDFNNILAVIQMHADLMKTDDGREQNRLDSADDIIAAVERAATLTRQLLLFSSREMFQPRDIELSDSIADTLKMVRRIVGEHIQMDVKLDSQPTHVHADRGMLDQVLLNLVVNARDAMPLGGRLVIETSCVDFDSSMVLQSSQERSGSFVCLSVSDSGCGIAPSVLPKIFEPFFTTKEVGKGTGLGLATVFGIVRQHNGWVTVYSEVGHGATFRVYLPRLSRDAVPKSSPAVRQVQPGGSETILLVEDDPELRLSVRRILSRLGYHILEAQNGHQALRVLQAYHHEIRLMLTDMVMPGGMTGTELTEQARVSHPHLKVICMSGYSIELVGKTCPLAGAATLLSKPFQVSELAQVVRDTLDQE
jgi:PAS domain S-box-containing protein